MSRPWVAGEPTEKGAEMHYVLAMTGDDIAKVLLGVMGAFILWNQHRAEENRKHQERQAHREREAVTRELKTNTAATRDVQHKINGWMTETLRTVAVQARRIAELSQRPDDIAAAEAAEARLRQHETEQAKIAMATARAALEAQDQMTKAAEADAAKSPAE